MQLQCCTCSFAGPHTEDIHPMSHTQFVRYTDTSGYHSNWDSSFPPRPCYGKMAGCTLMLLYSSNSSCSQL